MEKENFKYNVFFAAFEKDEERYKLCLDVPFKFVKTEIESSIINIEAKVQSNFVNIKLSASGWKSFSQKSERMILFKSYLTKTA